MSAGPENQNPSLRGTEGELVSIRIAAEPRLLEKLLDVLARLSFPINPQLTHDAEPATLVEFPAWAGRLPEIEEALARSGFDTACLSVTDMLAYMHAPAGPRHESLSRRRPLRAIA